MEMEVVKGVVEELWKVLVSVVAVCAADVPSVVALSVVV